MYTDAEITTTHRKEIMKRSQIKNFADNQTMEIDHTLLSSLTQYGGSPLVRLSQFAGSTSFHFAMTPDQARHMAAALIVHADAVEDEAALTTPATV
jgi:hypothetical protein